MHCGRIWLSSALQLRKGAKGSKELLAIVADGGDARLPVDARASLIVLAAQLQAGAIEKRIIAQLGRTQDQGEAHPALSGCAHTGDRHGPCGSRSPRPRQAQNGSAERRRERQRCSERAASRPSMTENDESVTHVSGINRNPCVRNGHSKNWRARRDSNSRPPDS
jgi:hypothetical protein